MTTRIFRNPCVWLAIFMAAGVSSQARSSTFADALNAQCRLGIEAAMLIDDGTSKVASDNLRAAISKADAVTTEVLDKKNPEFSEALSTWSQIKQDLSGLLSHGYDASTNWGYVMNQRNLRDSILMFSKNESLSDASRLSLDICDVVKNYLFIATSPMGAYSSSYNNSESDFPKNVAAIDTEIAKQLSKSSGDRQNRLKEVQTKWNFIRGSILSVDKRSTPFIVYRQGIAIIEILRE